MSHPTRTQVAPHASFEPIEPRTLLSLLGVGTELLVPDINYDSSGTLTYTAAADTFNADAAPTTIVFTPGGTPIRVMDPRDFLLNIRVGDSGQLLGGVAGPDMQIYGKADADRNGTYEYNGLLLTGEIVAFGYEEAGTSDKYDFVLIPTGGQLMPLFEGYDIGLTMSSANSTFAGNFGVNFTGKSQGVAGPIAHKYSSISGQVDNGQTGVAGVQIGLTGTDILGNVIDLTTTTAADGSWSFGQLRPGTYAVTEVQPAGLLDGDDSAGTAGGTAGDDVVSDIVLGYLTDATGYNFSELAPSSLAGGVYVGGAGISGAAVALAGTDDRGASVSLTATTAADGSYAFDGLRPGTYTISETQPAGVLDGDEAAGSLGGTVGNDVISDIALAAGQSGTGYAFGELAPSSLGGGVYVGGVGISGAAVALSGTDDRGAAVSDTATTAADGSYAFDGLRPGTYTISETQPAGVLDGDEAAGSLGGTVGNDVISDIALAAGQSGTGYAFGELAPSSLGGGVYVGGVGISGAAVALSGTDDRGAAVSDTATTAADGSYAFEGLRPGTYTISETQPAGVLDGDEAAGSLGGTVGNDVISDIALAAGQSGTGYAFGELAPSSLGGGVYVGGAGISGAAVALTGTDDRGASVNAAATTDGSGAFSFDGLRPGTYTISETQPAGVLDGDEAAGSLGGTVGNDVISDIALAAGQSGTGYAFGELAPASLAGGVYVGGVGISGAAVALSGTDDRGAAVSDTATTAADGSYAFEGLRPGTYTISETQPAGVLDGDEAAGSLGGTVGNDVISDIALAAGQSGTGYAFGELAPASLGGGVYVGGVGISGAAVALTGTDDRGAAVNAAATTAADGSYAFEGLRPGTYTISETQPAGVLDGDEAAGSLGGTVGNDVISDIALAAGQSGTGYAFGELAPSSLGGGVYVGGAGISGAAVALTGTDDRGASVNAAATTDGSGAFSFDGLRPGTYTISETQPAGVLDGDEAAGSLGGTVGNDVISDIALAAGQSGTGYAFGELAPASLAGGVYVGGVGISGAAVALTGTDDRGASVNAAATTAADGSYAFDGLRPGTYTISETQPSGVLDGDETAGSLGGTVGNDVISDIALAAGQSGTGYAFGELAPSSLSGGVYVGEVGIGGVDVALTGTDDRGASVSLTAATGADGSYAFDGLRPGTYAISETQPSGVLDGDDAAGSLGGTVGNDVISSIVVAAGQNGTGYIFTEIEQIVGSTIQGLVWEDFNNDGEVNFDEQVISGVTVLLTGMDDLGNAVNLTAVTDADGVYMFANLRPSNASGYTVREIQPCHFEDGVDVLGTVNGVAMGVNSANDRFTGIKITEAGSEASNYNFAELMSSGGRVIGSNQTATIGFWQNKKGQALIKALNGSSQSTQLGNWLAATFPNMYGGLAGKTNAQVAAYYMTLFKDTKKCTLGPAKLDAQIMAVALATYVTNSTLGGTTAMQYGFRVDEYGVGIRTINVGLAGYAFGVQNWSVQTVLELLWATDARSTNGRIYDVDGNGKTNCNELLMQVLANALYTIINELGHIGC